MSTNFEVKYTTLGQSMDSSYGYLSLCAPQIRIKQYDNVHRFTRVMNSSLGITHTSLLRSFYGHNTGSGKQFILYEDYPMTLDIWISNLKTKSDFYKRNVVLCAGSHRYINDDIRKLIRYILQFLKYLHENDKCTGGFKMKNITIKGGQPRFVDLELKKKDRKNQDEDFCSLRRLIQDIYKGHKMSLELENLLQLTRGWRGNEDLLYDHASLWESEERNTLIRSVCDYKEFCGRNTLKRDYYTALNGMNLPWYPRDWRLMVLPGTPWHKVYTDPATTQFHPYVPTGTSLVRFLRNCVVHLACTKLELWTFVSKRGFGSDLINHLSDDCGGNPAVSYQDQACYVMETLGGIGKFRGRSNREIQSP